MKVLILCHTSDNYCAFFLAKRLPNRQNSSNRLDIQGIEVSFTSILRTQLFSLLFCMVFSTTERTSHSPLFFRPSLVLLSLYMVPCLMCTWYLYVRLPYQTVRSLRESLSYLSLYLLFLIQCVEESKWSSSQTFPRIGWWWSVKGGGSSHQSSEQFMLMTPQSFKDILCSLNR